MKSINEPKDKDYFKELSKAHPHLQEFITDVATRYSKSPDGKIACEGHACLRRLWPEEFNVFVTPGPEYKPLVLCRECLRQEYAKVAASGEYDIHLRHLDKDNPLRDEK